jgi:hypothetical protein
MIKNNKMESNGQKDAVAYFTAGITILASILVYKEIENPRKPLLTKANATTET